MASAANKEAPIQPDKNLFLKSQIFEVLQEQDTIDEVSSSIASASLNNPNKDHDLFQLFRGFLILGRILGIVPFSGVFKRSYKDLRVSVCSIGGVTSICCSILLFWNFVFGVANSVRDSKRSALDIARAIQNPLFSFWGLFLYIYFLAKGEKFIKIFKFWATCNLHYTKEDTTLFRTIVLLSFILLSSCVLENAVLHMEFFEVFDDINGHIAKYGKETGNASVLQMYYWRAHLYWDRTIGYHPIFAVTSFFVHKCVLYGWNYADVLMALICRAVYFKFKVLYEVAEEKLWTGPKDSREDCLPSESGDRHAWELLVRDHDNLCDLVNIVNHFFSPIIFVSYTVNIYFVCMQLLTALTPDYATHSLVHSIYAPWSFIHIILRIFALSICAAKVNVYAHKIREIVQQCPVDIYNGPVAKLDKRVTVGPKLGITGLGCFVITKPFMLNILNVVFTIEIVLLQGLQTSQANSNQQECYNS